MQSPMDVVAAGSQAMAQIFGLLTPLLIALFIIGAVLKVLVEFGVFEKPIENPDWQGKRKNDDPASEKPKRKNEEFTLNADGEIIWIEEQPATDEMFHSSR